MIFGVPLPTGCQSVFGSHLAMFCSDRDLLDVEFYILMSRALDGVRLRQQTGGLAIVTGNAEEELRDVPSNSVAVVTDIFGAFTLINQRGNPLSYLRQVSPYHQDGMIRFRNFREEQHARDRSRRDGGRRRDRRSEEGNWD